MGAEDELFDLRVARKASPRLGLRRSWCEQVGLRQHSHGPFFHMEEAGFRCRGCGQIPQRAPSSGFDAWWARQMESATA